MIVTYVSFTPNPLTTHQKYAPASTSSPSTPHPPSPNFNPIQCLPSESKIFSIVKNIQLKSLWK